MTKKSITRKASDNEYLHKDFHQAMNAGIEYLDKNFGAQAVRDYLRQFTLHFYAPLREQLMSKGLVVLKEHFERIYQTEGAKFTIDLSEEALVLTVASCPAVAHIRKQGQPVARLFHETTRTVNEALCEGTEFHAELVEYDPMTGASTQRFCRKNKP